MNRGVANMIKRNNKGFTLIELLVVMSILGILMTILVANFQRIRVRGRDLRRKEDLTEMKKALQLYYSKYQTFPGDSSGQIAGCGSAGTTTCTWGNSFEDGNTTFMSLLPFDPVGNTYTYNQISGDEFTLIAVLENSSDQDIDVSQARCGAGSGNQFVVCQD